MNISTKFTYLAATIATLGAAPAARTQTGWQREHMSKNRLAIIPDRTHYEIGASPILSETVLPFLLAWNDAR
jgi:hypothetical protein